MIMLMMEDSVIESSHCGYIGLLMDNFTVFVSF